jgi:predicted nucleic acid-binding protein
VILLDTNVLLDIATMDSVWSPWSEQQFRFAASQAMIPINPIIYAELAPAFASIGELDRWLDPAWFQRFPLPYQAGWLAAQAFLKYRRSGGAKTSPLPDFYIGAHAEAEGRSFQSHARPMRRDQLELLRREDPEGWSLAIGSIPTPYTTSSRA